MTNSKYHKSNLENGIRVLTIPSRSTQAVTALLFVGTGSHHETQPLSGISHYLEHLFFKGSKKYPKPLIISTILDSLGAEYNAFTSHEMTGFYVKVVESKLDIALDVMSDFLKHPLFSPRAIEREKGVILEELHMYHDSPPRHVAEIFNQILYGNQPAGRDIGGIPESVRSITRRDVIKYFEQQYRGENMVLVFAGDITHSRGVRLARKYFAALPGGSGSSKPPVSHMGSTAPVLKCEERPTDQTHLVLGFPGVHLSDKRRFSLAVAAAVLGGGMSSRLFTEVREKRGLAYTVRAGIDSGTDYGEFTVSGGITNSKVEEALAVIVRELKKLKTKRVGADELQKAKNAIEGHFYLGLESSDAVADFWGEQEILLDKTRSPQEYMKYIRGVSANDVQEAVRTVLLKKEARLAIVGPRVKKNKLRDILNKL